MSAARLILTFFSSLWMGVACAAERTTTAYSFSFLKLEDGALLPLSNYKGKVLLVVNTASQCGFTPQYTGLEALYEKYKDRGLVVIGVPANDFGAQEPGTAEEIQEFTKEKYHITFPLTQKETVVGPKAHPFYRWAAGAAGPLGTPKWNFHKFLIGTDGQLIDWYASTTAPSNAKLTQAIEAALPK